MKSCVTTWLRPLGRLVVCAPLFLPAGLSIATKQCVYIATVVYNCCIKCILGISHRQQWREQITTGQLASEFGMTEGVNELLALRRLR